MKQLTRPEVVRAIEYAFAMLINGQRLKALRLRTEVTPTLTFASLREAAEQYASAQGGHHADGSVDPVTAPPEFWQSAIFETARMWNATVRPEEEIVTLSVPVPTRSVVAEKIVADLQLEKPWEHDDRVLALLQEVDRLRKSEGYLVDALNKRHVTLQNVAFYLQRSGLLKQCAPALVAQLTPYLDDE